MSDAPNDRSAHSARDPRPNPLESTLTLLERARAGDSVAQGILLERYRPVLERWAHGRLRPGARDLAETADLVQMTLIRAYKNLEHFEPRHEGAFLAYLRQILANQVRDEVRHWQRMPGRADLHEGIEDRGALPLEDAIGRETVERYEGALGRLSDEQREAIVLRVEMGMPFEEVAEKMQRPSANAARLLLRRALIKLSEEMDDRGG